MQKYNAKLQKIDNYLGIKSKCVKLAAINQLRHYSLSCFCYEASSFFLIAAIAVLH